MFAISWLVAPLAGWYFNDERAIPVIRVLALTFPISAMSNVHSNLLSKALQFRRRFVPDFLRSVAKGIFSVIFALLGFGAWSLVFGQVLGTLATVISYWSVFPWRPAFEFDRQIARELLSYGVNVVVVDSLGMLLLNLDYLFVGRFLGTEALGVYSLAFRMPDLLITQFCATVSGVLFPIYVKMRDDANSLGNGFLMAMRYVSMVTIPLGLGLIMVARPFVLTFLTDKWVDAIPVIQAIALYATFFSLAYNAGSLYKATGKPYILTRLALVRLALLVPVLYYAAAVAGNIQAVGYGHALVAFISGLINLYVAGRMVNVRLLDMFTSLRASVLSGLGMVLALLLVNTLTVSFIPLIQLLLATSVGGMVYLALLVFQQPDLVPTIRRMALALRRS
jgi:PST family polysaccharide transporter